MRTFVFLILTFVAITSTWALEEAEISIDPQTRIGHVDQFIYGQFLEHICNSTDLGLHVEMLTERSFEYPGVEVPLHPVGDAWTTDSGRWGEADGALVQTSFGTIGTAFAGDPSWTDYDFTFEVRKYYGTGGPVVVFRANEEQVASYVWHCGTAWGTVSEVSVSGENGKKLLVSTMPYRRNVWRKFKVSLRGPQIRLYVDDMLLHEVYDDTVTAGRIGLAQMNAWLAYRNVRVTAPDGTVLFEDNFNDSPIEPTDIDVGLKWSPIGFDDSDATAYRTKENPLNSEYALVLDLNRGSDKPIGIRQANVPAKAGAAYDGYIYARKEGFKGDVKVLWTSADGNTVYARAELDRPKKRWEKLTFSLTPNTTDPNAAISFMAEGKGALVLDQASLLPAGTDMKAPFRKELVDAGAALHPRIIRYPGGCFASIYWWKDGIGPVDDRPVMPTFDWEGTGGVDPNHFGTDEFMAFCQATAAEPLLVINIAAGPEYAAEWVEYCNGSTDTPMGALRARNGHPLPYNVKYWSLDNEQWALDSKEYGRLAAECAAAMTAVDPDLHFWAVGAYPGNEEYDVEVLKATRDYTEYMSMHAYWNGVYEDVVASNLYFEDWFKTLDAQFKEVLPGKRVRVAFDEWNPGDTDFKSGLASAALLNSMERQSDIVGMSAPALWYRNRSSKAWDNALIQFDQTRQFMSPTYYAMKMWSQNFAAEMVASETTCGTYMPPEFSKVKEPVPYLDVVATRYVHHSRGKIILKVVNRHKTDSIETTIRIKPSDNYTLGNEGEGTVLCAPLDVQNTLDEPEAVVPQSFTVKDVGHVMTHTFPAHSATVLVLPAYQKRQRH